MVTGCGIDWKVGPCALGPLRTLPCCTAAIDVARDYTYQRWGQNNIPRLSVACRENLWRSELEAICGPSVGDRWAIGG